jgi:iron(III) transport system permease protein
MGAVVSVILLVPAVVAFVVDRLVQRKQVALLSAKAVPLVPKKNPKLDWALFAFCSVVALLILAMIGMAQYAALVKFWPYDLSLTLPTTTSTSWMAAAGSSFFNSLRMSLYTAFFGTLIIFYGAYLVEKGRGFRTGRTALSRGGHPARWRCRAWCWGSPTSSSSTTPKIRSISCTGPWRSW